MTAIIRTRPLVQQPQFVTGINWVNPITKRLAFAWTGVQLDRELTTGATATTNNASSVIGKHGRASHSSVSQINTEWNNQFITTSSSDGLGDFTMVVLANPAASNDNIEHIFCQKNDAAGAPYSQCLLAANSTFGASALSGSFAFFTYANTFSAVAAEGAVDGDWHVFIGVRRGTSHELYRDGALVASAGLTVKNISQASRYTAIGSRGNGTTESYARDVACAYGFDRALSVSEIKSISENPWQVFRPRVT